ncbi:hypothetical protein AMTR_s00060p00123390 [Amborella trichopoda]|uniref:Uncharacterized protein n=1 Tax=Amborella trichopoda TaxID=13333 RepID=W1NJA7_AMBTC|nr:hypothetical protein AMTR_s00060p00123390 [Amborella trichopoda]
MEDEISSLQARAADLRVRWQHNREVMTERSQRLRRLRSGAEKHLSSSKRIAKSISLLEK